MSFPILHGTSSRIVDLGQVETRLCKICNREREFRLFLQYRFEHMYFLFGKVTERRYRYVCPECNQGWDVPEESVEPHLRKNPIPFLTRYGGYIFVAVAAAVILFVLFDPLGWLRGAPRQ